MKPRIFEGQKINTSPAKPWMLAVRYVGHYTLYGLSYRGENVAGLASSSSFSDLALDTLAVGAYYIDVGPVPKQQADTLSENGPAVDTQLAPLTSQFGDLVRSHSSMVEAITAPDILNMMSLVSVDIFAQMWRVMGAKIGRHDGEEIVWEKQLVYKETILPN
jgi:hypothetical protein